ncbi:Hypothetical predicted protein [Mytilus galloprovincialis]|uniref:B box-type domain-containing protein n=1 Tax=Mytilus galloprovincialis TaxID=29158 RepID=A0A8B6H1Q6_MYTGA|nr:Hypothetical predicted protein [Mytilus galloprovincialis]
MAFSQLKGEAQTPVTCQFCEESSDIRWRCINCDVFMCQICTTKIHRKIKSAEKHEILNLKDCGGIDAAQAIRKVELQDMPCSTHIGHTCCVYCMDCGKPVCASCLIESHQKHKYKTLNEIYDTTFSKMKEVQNKLESSLEFFDYEKERLHKLHLDGAKNFQKIKNEITLTEKEISEIISKYAKELVQELESIWKPTENKIKAELSDMQKKKDNLLKREENLKKIFLSHQASDIFNSRKLLDETAKKINGDLILRHYENEIYICIQT